MRLTDEQINTLAGELHKTAGTLGIIGNSLKPLWKAMRPKIQKAFDWSNRNFQERTIRPIQAGDTTPGTVRNFFGLGFKAKQVGMAARSNPNLPTNYGQGFLAQFSPKHILAELGHNMQKVQRMGVGNYLKENIQHARTFESGGGVYRRSLPGQLFNVAMTGPGFAATDILLAPKDQSMGKTLGTAGTDLALWSVSPRLGGAALMARMGYDLMKKKNQPQIKNIQNDTQIIQ